MNNNSTPPDELLAKSLQEEEEQLSLSLALSLQLEEEDNAQYENYTINHEFLNSLQPPKRYIIPYVRPWATDPLLLLPRDIAFYMLTFFNFHELAILAQVSRRWHAFTTDNDLWRKFYTRIIGPIVKKKKKTGKGSKKKNQIQEAWRQTTPYKQQFKIEYLKLIAAQKKLNNF